MKVKSCFWLMTKIDIDKFPKILEYAIRTIFLAVRNLNLNSNFDLI
jgi:hypothetical protein